MYWVSCAIFRRMRFKAVSSIDRSTALARAGRGLSSWRLQRGLAGNVNAHAEEFFATWKQELLKANGGIPDSELIQISRGYAALLILSLIYSAIIGPRKLYYGYSLKLLAVFFLVTGIALDVPKSVWQSLGSRQMNAFEYPEGKETSFIRTLYYSGFIAFSVGNLPITVPSFAS